MTEAVDPYEIIITEEDVIASGHGMKPDDDMVKISVLFPKRLVRRIDKAAAGIGTTRPNVFRAMVRQAIENEAAVIRTKWGRSHVV